MPTGIQLSSGVVVGQPIPLDAKFGPYNSTTAALNDIGVGLRYRGLTVGVFVSGVLKEYWFKDGTANGDFVAKSSDVTWDSLLNKPSTFPPSAHTHPASQITDFAAAVAAEAPPESVYILSSSTTPDEFYSSPANSLWIAGNTGDFVVLTFGTPLTGFRYIQGATTGTTGIRIVASGSPSYASSQIPAGSISRISYNGGGAMNTTLISRIDHGHIAFTGSTNLPLATTTENGLMTGSDKAKYDAVAFIIDRTGTGSIQLGVSGTRTTLSGTATVDRAISLPDAPGTISLEGHTHSAATTTVAGFLSAADKTKLDGVAASANNYVAPNHTGDVTSLGDGATTISNDAVTNAKLANVTSQTIKGRATSTTGDPEDLTAAQVRSILNVANGAEVNVNADWNATTGDAQILNKPILSGVGWGPLVINRFRNFYFASSGYAPNGQTPQGMFPLTPTSGNVLEGWLLGFPFPRIFNPNQFLGPGVGYYITAYVRVSGSFNDGIHCQIRSYDGTGVSIVSGLGDFGGLAGAADRIHFATSSLLLATDTFYSYALYCGAYDTNNSNGAVIQDTVLTFHRAP